MSQVERARAYAFDRMVFSGGLGPVTSAQCVISFQCVLMSHAVLASDCRSRFYEA
jgi:hypothetical protein